MDLAVKSSAAAAQETALRWRRAFVTLLCLCTMALLVWGMTLVLGHHGWTAAAILFLVIYLIGLPWTLLGFWNAVIGFVILRLVRDPATYTNPAMRDVPPNSAIVTRTAICLAVRNEDAAAVFARLKVMITSIADTGAGNAFDFHILSDSNKAEVIAAEESLLAALQSQTPGARLHYRNRTVNTGYKAGNLEEFAARCQSQYDFMIVLDADSVMSGRAMLRLVRIMQSHDRLGILQTLAVGRPSDSGFTRIFQFGMRHGMHTQTTGSAWWQGSAGPYWGHNAIIRIAPFIAHCRLPVLPGRGPLAGWILSHDQVEAALMRGAGWEVRVVPEEFESWEENPPNLPDFIKRDLRWCQGNLQYLHLLGMRGLSAMGRFQLINAIMMYAGAPMNLLMLAAGVAITLEPGAPPLATGLAFRLYAISMALGFIPRLLGVLDTLLRGKAASYGGGARIIAGSILDFFFSLLIGPLMMVAQTIFIAGLAFGRRILWDAPIRAGRAIPLREAIHGLWPQTLFGLAVLSLLALFAPYAIIWACLTIIPCLLAVPFACITASRGFSRALVQGRICAIPEEFAQIPELD